MMMTATKGGETNDRAPSLDAHLTVRTAAAAVPLRPRVYDVTSVASRQEALDIFQSVHLPPPQYQQPPNHHHPHHHNISTATTQRNRVSNNAEHRVVAVSPLHVTHHHRSVTRTPKNDGKLSHFLSQSVPNFNVNPIDLTTLNRNHGKAATVLADDDNDDDDDDESFSVVDWSKEEQRIVSSSRTAVAPRAPVAPPKTRSMDSGSTFPPSVSGQTSFGKSVSTDSIATFPPSNNGSVYTSCSMETRITNNVYTDWKQKDPQALSPLKRDQGSLYLPPTLEAEEAVVNVIEKLQLWNDDDEEEDEDEGNKNDDNNKDKDADRELSPTEEMSQSSSQNVDLVAQMQASSTSLSLQQLFAPKLEMSRPKQIKKRLLVKVKNRNDPNQSVRYKVLPVDHDDVDTNHNDDNNNNSSSNRRSEEVEDPTESNFADGEHEEETSLSTSNHDELHSSYGTTGSSLSGIYLKNVRRLSIPSGSRVSRRGSAAARLRRRFSAEVVVRNNDDHDDADDAESTESSAVRREIALQALIHAEETAELAAQAAARAAEAIAAVTAGNRKKKASSKQQQQQQPQRPGRRRSLTENPQEAGFGIRRRSLTRGLVNRRRNKHSSLEPPKDTTPTRVQKQLQQRQRSKSRGRRGSGSTSVTATTATTALTNLTAPAVMQQTAKQRGTSLGRRPSTPASVAKSPATAPGSPGSSIGQACRRLSASAVDEMKNQISRQRDASRRRCSPSTVSAAHFDIKVTPPLPMQPPTHIQQSRGSSGPSICMSPSSVNKVMQGSRRRLSNSSEHDHDNQRTSRRLSHRSSHSKNAEPSERDQAISKESHREGRSRRRKSNGSPVCAAVPAAPAAAQEATAEISVRKRRTSQHRTSHPSEEIAISMNTSVRQPSNHSYHNAGDTSRRGKSRTRTPTDA